MLMSTTITLADYSNPTHQAAIIELLDEYARDPMGGGEGLSNRVKENLPTTLADTANAFSILALVDGDPAGLINCFQTLSTFKCKPLVNIHDVMVSKALRGRGLSTAMLKEVEKIAQQRGCCKLTLEVLEGNSIARNAYAKFGFSGYELDPAMGKAMFWEKPLA
jgi:GNAT superfamily N-acetyltransferase